MLDVDASILVCGKENKPARTGLDFRISWFRSAMVLLHYPFKSGHLNHCMGEVQRAGMTWRISV